MESCTPLTQCLTCCSKEIKEILNLGLQPLANSFHEDASEEQDRYPLQLNVCTIGMGGNYSTSALSITALFEELKKTLDPLRYRLFINKSHLLVSPIKKTI